DSDTGLVYMQARYYDPVIGRFYSNDPVGVLGHVKQGSVQGFNRYKYSYNNPLKLIDPDGRLPFDFANLFNKNEGAEKAREVQVKVAEDTIAATETAFEVTVAVAEAVNDITPGGKTVKAASAIVNAAIKASDSEKPLETLGTELAIEAFGVGVGKKLDAFTQATHSTNEMAKEVAVNVITTELKDEFREAVEDRQ
ncbi:RHS repeat-associated core domain-containing protein, partial [Glaciecola sp. XM2]|uniref:RHS repeat-associated core domain-containing protein n=1 Tax=Glaciecola sp. XM2 TaxID=1914931 RepID=UPI001BDF08BD